MCKQNKELQFGFFFFSTEQKPNAPQQKMNKHDRNLRLYKLYKTQIWPLYCWADGGLQWRKLGQSTHAGMGPACSLQVPARPSFNMWKWEVIPQGSGAPRAQARMLLPAHSRQTRGCLKPQKIDPPGLAVCSPRQRPGLAWPGHPPTPCRWSGGLCSPKHPGIQHTPLLPRSFPSVQPSTQ